MSDLRISDFSKFVSNMRSFLLAGLGNFTHPRTRHNAGFFIVEHLASKFQSPFVLKKTHDGWITSIVLDETQLYLYKPK